MLLLPKNVVVIVYIQSLHCNLGRCILRIQFRYLCTSDKRLAIYLTITVIRRCCIQFMNKLTDLSPRMSMSHCIPIPDVVKNMLAIPDVLLDNSCSRSSSSLPSAVDSTYNMDKHMDERTRGCHIFQRDGYRRMLALNGPVLRSESTSSPL